MGNKDLWGFFAMNDNHMYTVVIMECLYENKMTAIKGEMMQESDMDTVLDTCAHNSESPSI